jgi:hypothetical protein
MKLIVLKKEISIYGFRILPSDQARQTRDPREGPLRPTDGFQKV